MFGDDERQHSMFGLKLQLLVAAYYPHADGPHLTDSQLYFLLSVFRQNALRRFALM